MVDHDVCLLIENTGACGAKDIKIAVDHIKNNGEYGLSLDALFQNTFELYLHEIVQGRVAMSGRNIVTATFPQIFVHVSYVRADINRRNEYCRTVTFDGGYSQKVVADVKVDKHSLESDVDCIARSVVRVANYLDGHQVAKFDELNLLADRSLQNDLVSAIKTRKKSPIVSRVECIRKRIR